MASDFAMSKPVIVPARREVWYTDGATGFYALRVAESAWPGEDAGAGGAGKKGCLSVGRRIRHQGIGKVRLGMTRKALLRRLPAPRHGKKRAWRWCVRGGGKVTAAFTKRGRVALVSTTARVPLKRARLRAFRHPRSLGHGLVRPFRGSHRLFTVRHGKVRVVSIASSRTIKRRALLRRYLRAASSA
jgi:predicted RNA binding protein YcfA (HicA-like mRNA interferase family)